MEDHFNEWKVENYPDPEPEVKEEESVEDDLPTTTDHAVNIGSTYYDAVNQSMTVSNGNAWSQIITQEEVPPAVKRLVDILETKKILDKKETLHILDEL